MLKRQWKNNPSSPVILAYVVWSQKEFLVFIVCTLHHNHSNGERELYKHKHTLGVMCL